MAPLKSLDGVPSNNNKRLQYINSIQMKYNNKFLMLLMFFFMSTVVFSSCEDDEEDELGADTCYSCKGTEKIKGNVCPTCLGSGKLGDSDSSSDDEDDDDKNQSNNTSSKKCMSCEVPGNGVCKTCSGSGFIYGMSLNKMPCPKCKNNVGKCRWCGGTGKR